MYWSIATCLPEIHVLAGTAQSKDLGRGELEPTEGRVCLLVSGDGGGGEERMKWIGERALGRERLTSSSQRANAQGSASVT